MRCVILAAMGDYYEQLELVKSLDDYEAYSDRFPKFLPSMNMHANRVPFRKYRASCMMTLFSAEMHVLDSDVNVIIEVTRPRPQCARPRPRTVSTCPKPHQAQTCPPMRGQHHGTILSQIITRNIV